MNRRLILAIPSKGRMRAGIEERFAKANFPITNRARRGYFGKIENLPDIEVRYLSAAETARRVIQGRVDIGITGEDLLCENLLTNFAPDLHKNSKILLNERLEVKKIFAGLGDAQLIVAADTDWFKLGITTMHDLAELAEAMRVDNTILKVATKYTQLTREFFRKFNIDNYMTIHSDGATEAAITAGDANVIIDITSTGATLKANQLEIFEDGEILKTEAVLAINRTIRWQKPQFSNSIETLSEKLSSIV